MNLTSVTLANPELSLAINGTASSTPTALKLGGILANQSLGESGGYQAITGLASGDVWATLVPSSSQGALTVTATLGSWAVNGLSNQALSNNGVAYISAQTPTSSVGAVVPSFQSVAVSPDGKTLYGIDTQDGILVVSNAADLTQLQTFREGNNPLNGKITPNLGLQNAVSVAVSPNGANVYVIGYDNNTPRISTFTRDMTTGILTFQNNNSVSLSLNSLTSLAVAGSPTSSE